MLIPKHMFDMLSKNNNLTQTNSPVDKKKKIFYGKHTYHRQLFLSRKPTSPIKIKLV